MYMQAAIAILAGTTYDKYAQIIKSCGLEALSPDIYYELTAGKIYEAAKTVWSEWRKLCVPVL